MGNPDLIAIYLSQGIIHTRTHRRYALSAMPGIAERICRPGIQLGARNAIPGLHFPTPEIKLDQSWISRDIAAQRAGKQVAALQGAAAYRQPDRQPLGKALYSFLPASGQRQISAAVTNTWRYCCNRMPYQVKTHSSPQ